MTISRDAVCVSYAACRRFSRRAGSNFYAGFLLLPRAKRRAMDALYAFMRHTDDLADNPQPANLHTHALVRWRAALEHALLGCFDRPGTEPHSPVPSNDPEEQVGRDLLPALADAVKRFQIPPEHLRAVIDGVEMDLKRRRYETFDELKRYCELVASAVGLACIHIWGFRGPEALVPARKCGIALQLTNILRDLRDDAEQDRVYLPLADLRECAYTEDDLLQGVADGRFRRLVALEVERTEQFYREGAVLLDLLEPDGRRVFGMMMAVYRAILKKIKRRPDDVLLRRVHLSRPKKLQIAARWTLLPPRVTALL
jgi:15-cis-phytoene synthase